jgi:hypothetical protein
MLFCHSVLWRKPGGLLALFSTSTQTKSMIGLISNSTLATSNRAISSTPVRNGQRPPSPGPKTIGGVRRDRLKTLTRFQLSQYGEIDRGVLDMNPEPVRGGGWLQRRVWGVGVRLGLQQVPATDRRRMYVATRRIAKRTVLSDRPIIFGG